MIVDLNLVGKRAAVVGGGAQGYRKSLNLLEAGAEVLILSKTFCKSILRLAEAGKVRLEKTRIDEAPSFVKRLNPRPYLLVAATDDKDLNAHLAKHARASGCMVYVVDDPSLSDFTQPAIANVEGIKIAVSTEGRSPIMAKTLSLRLEKLIKREDVLQVRLQQYARTFLRQHVVDRGGRKKFLYTLLKNPKIKALLRKDRFNEAKELTEEMLQTLVERQQPYSIIDVAATYRKCPVRVLQDLRFKDPASTYRELLNMKGVRECCIIQTCNRVEVTVVSGLASRSKVEEQVIENWRRNSGNGEGWSKDLFEIYRDKDALLHLLRLSSGLESMVIGEEQILGQVKDAFDEAQKSNAIGLTLTSIMACIIKAGVEVRKATAISKGSVSLGSVGVKFVEFSLGGLEGKRALLVGAGEIMKSVRDALGAKGLSEIYVAGRNLEKMKAFAEAVGGVAITLSEAPRVLGSVDLVVVATSAPNLLLTEKEVREARQGGACKPLLILDLSNPANVEDGVAAVEGVRLANLDSLRQIAEENLANRRKEAEKAEEIVETELQKLLKTLRRRSVEPLISNIFNSAEDLRRREVGKALRRMKGLSDQNVDVLNNLTISVVEGILSRPAAQLRIAAMNSDREIIEVAEKIFSDRGAP